MHASGLKWLELSASDVLREWFSLLCGPHFLIYCTLQPSFRQHRNQGLNPEHVSSKRLPHWLTKLTIITITIRIQDDACRRATRWGRTVVNLDFESYIFYSCCNTLEKKKKHRPYIQRLCILYPSHSEQQLKCLQKAAFHSYPITWLTSAWNGWQREQWH